MSKHTPGVWKYQVNRYGDHKSGVIDAANSPLNEPIAIIPHDDCTAKQYKISKANARLIAAAPDLLEALKDAQATIDAMIRAIDEANDSWPGDNPQKWLTFCDSFDLIGEVLEKAEGKEGA